MHRGLRVWAMAQSEMLPSPAKVTSLMDLQGCGSIFGGRDRGGRSIDEGQPRPGAEFDAASHGEWLELAWLARRRNHHLRRRGLPAMKRLEIFVAPVVGAICRIAFRNATVEFLFAFAEGLRK
jgi:hypothetical protein